MGENGGNACMRKFRKRIYCNTLWECSVNVYIATRYAFVLMFRSHAFTFHAFVCTTHARTTHNARKRAGGNYGKCNTQKRNANTRKKWGEKCAENGNENGNEKRSRIVTRNERETRYENEHKNERGNVHTFTRCTFHGGTCGISQNGGTFVYVALRSRNGIRGNETRERCAHFPHSRNVLHCMRETCGGTCNGTFRETCGNVRENERNNVTT